MSALDRKKAIDVESVAIKLEKFFDSCSVDDVRKANKVFEFGSFTPSVCSFVCFCKIQSICPMCYFDITFLST